MDNSLNDFLEKAGTGNKTFFISQDKLTLILCFVFVLATFGGILFLASQGSAMSAQQAPNREGELAPFPKQKEEVKGAQYGPHGPAEGPEGSPSPTTKPSPTIAPTTAPAAATPTNTPAPTTQQSTNNPNPTTTTAPQSTITPTVTTPPTITTSPEPSETPTLSPGPS